jgi:hypothetical protein
MSGRSKTQPRQWRSEDYEFRGHILSTQLHIFAYFPVDDSWSGQRYTLASQLALAVQAKQCMTPGTELNYFSEAPPDVNRLRG